jgi:ketosteroid isomerase-like protein
LTEGVSQALEVVTKAVQLAQQAREDGSDAAWKALALHWAEDVEIRVADSRAGGKVWRVTAQGRQAALERLSRRQVSASRLRTTTVRAWASADESIVVVEQLSETADDDGHVVAVPVCHIFEVSEGLIRRQSVYRNEAF